MLPWYVPLVKYIKRGFSYGKDFINDIEFLTTRVFALLG